MLFFFFALAAISFLPSLHAMSCIQTVNGTTYNLTSLHEKGDISVIPSSGAYNYYINVCGAVQGPCANHTSAFACQVRNNPLDQFESVLAYSDVNHTAPTWGPSTSKTGGVKLTFTNGDACNQRQRILNIDFQCDITGTRTISIDESPQCTFNVIFPTNRTCIESPSSSSSSSSTGASTSSSSSASHTNSSSSTGSHSNSSSSTGSHSNSSSSTGSHSNSSSSTGSSTGPHPSNSSSAIPSNSSSAIPSNSSSAIPSNFSSSIIPSNYSSSSIIPSNSSSTSILSSSSIPGPSSTSTGPIPPMSSTGHQDSSTGTIPSKEPESSTVTITGAGIGIGILIGTSVTSALVLIWCCWDRSRRRSNTSLNTERSYASLDA